MTKCALLVIQTVVVGDNTSETLPTTNLLDSLSRPQYSRARFVKEVTRRRTGDRKFLSPWGVVCTPSGIVVVTDWSHCLQMFTEDLEHIRSVGSRGTAAGQFCHPTGITTDRLGQVFITDSWNKRIQVVDEQGNHLYMFGTKDTGPGQYYSPYGIAIDTNQRMYVCDTSNRRVQVIEAEGRHLSMLTQTGPGPAQLRATPWFISSDSHNHVTITDVDGNLYMFNDKCEQIRTMLFGQPGCFSVATDTVTDAWGTLLVADYKEGCVCVLGVEGHVSCRIGSKGKGPGQIGQPSGIALTNRGDLIVCDYANSKILKFKIPTSAN